MEAPATALTRTEADPSVPRTLVWIDAREAFIARWEDGVTSFERLESDVPAHHKSTGHVGHDPGIRHGGGGRQQTAGDPHRIEHLNRFMEQVSARLPATDHLTIIGPGTVHERLASLVRDGDLHHHHGRTVTSESATRQTEKQLLARVRALAGVVPRRRTVGAYRWTGRPAERLSGEPMPIPGRVVKKAPRERGPSEEEIEAALQEPAVE